MLGSIDFAKCIRENLKDRNFGKERADEIIADFEARSNYYKTMGRDGTTAATLAMKDTFDNISANAIEKAKRTAKMLAVQAQNNERIAQGLKVDVKAFTAKDATGEQIGPRGSRGVALARAAISLIEDDPRFSGLSYSTLKKTYRGQLWAIMGDVLDKVSKGTFGVQRGKAHMPNIVREIFGEHSGDMAAKEIAHAWLKVSDVGVDLFNQAGGSLKKLARYIPQAQNAAKIVSAGFEKWRDAHLSALDWSKMRFPDGTLVEAGEREALLKNVYDTFTTDGASKIDATAFRGRGKALGNALDSNRFLHYKDAQSWMDIHNQFGDGNVFDVMVKHVDSMSHKLAMLETFGPNPELTFNNISAIVKKQAAGLGPKEVAIANKLLKNKFQPMLDVATHANPLDPNSTMGALVSGVSNILTAAQLGSASLLAIPGDFAQAVAVRQFNHMGLMGGVDFYVKSLATDRHFMEQISTQSGFVMDEVVMSTYGAQRFSGLATIGPHVTRRISDTVMRATLMSGHTKSARWACQAEFMGLLQRSRTKALEDVPFAQVFQRYGIDSKEWDTVRKALVPWEPKQGIKFMRPVDILKTDLPNKQALYNKFQGMIFEESKKMVPESTIEGTVSLKDTTRPDTIPGVLLHSFSMYKNFPISFQMIYGRLGMTSPSVKGRLGFYAGLGAAMTTVGALGVQMRELVSGRDPLPMDTPQFYGKAFLAGGAMSIWGDFLFGGVNRTGSTPAETAAGPLLGALGDTTQLALGDTFQWANSIGSLDGKDHDSKTPAKAVEYLKRYTPGSNIWWARLALQREVWDRLSEIADPKAYARERRTQQFQQQTYGNDYWWKPGDRTPDRLPHYQGRQ